MRRRRDIREVELRHLRDGVQDRVELLADDEPRPSLPREVALANAPEAEDGAFRVPPT